MTNEEYKLLLLSLGMTQREATTEIHGLSPNTFSVYTWTTGQGNIPPKQAQRILDYRRKVLEEADRRRKIIQSKSTEYTTEQTFWELDLNNPFERAVNIALVDEWGIE